jgi:nitroimidazol reductase NimA-like FMN-containing flavoprotein (pyridoxamine 5'-phosphate oxidase superfamily)
MTSTELLSGLAGNFAEIPRAMCEELLRSKTVGRVAWNGGDGPCLFPVNYAFREGTIVFRTSPYGALSVLARRTAVAFEIDQIDEEGGTGWNVMVSGHAEGVSNDYLLSSLWTTGPVPWASGTRTLFVAITPRRITGRVVRAPFAGASA